MDAGSFQRDVLVLTGSSSLRLRGRRNSSRAGWGGREVVAWPLSFRDPVLEQYEGPDF